MYSDFKYDSALACYQRGQIDRAIELLKQLLADDPELAHYHGLLALCLLAKKRIYAAEYEVHIALKINAEDALFHYILASISVLKNKLKQALEHCDESLRLNPEYTDSLLLKSDIFQLLDRDRDSLQSIHYAAQVEPDSLAVSLAYGEYYLKRGTLDKAQSFIHEAMAKDPQNQNCNILMGQLKLKAGEIDEALKLAKFAILQNPDSPAALKLFCDIKTRQNLFLGLWWRFNSKMASFSSTKASIVLISMFLVFNLLAQLMYDLDHKTLSKVLSYGWLLFVLYSWIGLPMYYPNPDIENTIIAQSLGTPSKSKKHHITNKVTRYFLDSLCIPMAYTLIRISISGLGY
ncbi:MAG: tetratricopeptide repeat protein [Proteobacteria bacterium]|nr:tetratricopeptide repeat protein [Pseudomonadota bacterium]